MLNKEDFDKLLKESSREAEEMLLIKIPSDEQLDYRFSISFQERMKKVIKMQKRKAFLKKFNKVNRRIAVMIAVIGISILTLVMGVEAWRLKLFETMTQIFRQYTTLSFEQTREEEREFNWKSVISLPQSIPEGFNEVERIENDNVIEVIYRNDIGEIIIFTQFSLEYEEFQMDTENHNLERINFNQKEGYFFSNKGAQFLFWRNEYSGFKLFSTLSKEALIRIAKSIS